MLLLLGLGVPLDASAQNEHEVATALNRMLEGARACKLPDGYVAFLESLRVEDFDPA